MKIRLRLLYAILMCIALAPAALVSQRLTLSRIDASGFPRVTAEVMVTEETGSSVRNVSPTDFGIRVNGVPVDPSRIVNINCPEVNPTPPPVNVCMIIDMSESMGLSMPNNNTLTRLQAVQSGASAFIDNFQYVPGSSVALTAFHATSYLIRDWQTSETGIQNLTDDIFRLDQSQTVFGTDYNLAFLDPVSGAIAMLKRRPDQNRIIVFLTDGAPLCDNGRTNAGDLCPKWREIIDSCNANNIQVYGISVAVTADPNLKKICEERTPQYADLRGKLFSEVNSREQVEAIYTQIAEIVHGVAPCTIEWIDDYACDPLSLSKTASLTYIPSNAVQQASYTVPASGVVNMRYSESVMGFGNPDIGTPVPRTLTIEALGAPVTITSATFSGDAAYFTEDLTSRLPLQVLPGTPLQVNITFQQAGDIEYRRALLNLGTSYCNIPQVAVWGGLSSVGPPKISVEPSGAVFSACDSITIQWSGVEDSRFVNLSYSTNGGATWNIIATDLADVNLTHRWQAPVDGSYIFRVTVSESSGWEWVRGAGSSGADKAEDIALDDEGNSFVVVETPDTYRIATNRPDVAGPNKVLSKYSKDGTPQWSIVTGFPVQMVGEPTMQKVAVTASGTAYVLYRRESYPASISNLPIGGEAVRQFVQSDPTTPAPQWIRRFNTAATALIDIAIPLGANYPIVSYYEKVSVGSGFPRFVLSRLDSTNGVVTELFDERDAIPEAMAIDPSGAVFVVGRSSIDAGTSASNKFRQKGINTSGLFLARFVPLGNTLSLDWARLLPAGPTVVDIATDINGNAVLTGTFSGGSVPYETATLQSRQSRDIYVSKFTNSGSFVWVRSIAGTGGASAGNDDPAGVDTDNGGSIYVAGRFENAQIEDQTRTIRARSRGGADAFVARLRADGTCESIISAGSAQNDGARGIAVFDRDGSLRVTGNFGSVASSTPDAVFGSRTIQSQSGQDVFLSHLVQLAAGSGQSEIASIVASPEPVWNRPDGTPVGAPELVQTTPVGRSTVFILNLCNTSDVDMLVNGLSFTGANGGDFQLVDQSLIGSTIPANTCQAVEFSFSPSGEGTRTAQLELDIDCIDALIAQLAGVGKEPCPGTALSFSTDFSGSVGQTSVITLNNAYTNTSAEAVELTVSLIEPAGTPAGVFQLVSPANVTVAPGGTHTPVINYTPVSTERLPITVDFGLGSTCAIVSRFFAFGIQPDTPPEIVAVAPAPLVQGCAEEHVFVTAVFNQGGEDLVVSGLNITGPQAGEFTVLTPTPLTVAPTANASISVRWVPASTINGGVANALLTITSNDEDTPDTTVAMVASSDRIGAFTSSQSTVNFGVGRPSNYPMTQVITISNPSSVALRITSATITPAGSSFGFTPALANTVIPAGGSIPVTIQMNDPGVDDVLATATFSVVGDVSCDGSFLSVPLEGIRQRSNIVLAIDPLSASPLARNVNIPVRMTAGSNYDLAVGDSVDVEIRTRAWIFLPTAIANGSIVSSVITGDERVFTARVQAPAGSSANFTTITGDVLLGDQKSTPLVFTITRWDDVFVNNRIETEINVTGICEEGGDQLVKQSSTVFGITSVTPNPSAGNVITVTVAPVEVGMHSLSLVTPSGASVWGSTWTQSLPPAGSLMQPVTFAIPTSALASGQYRLLLLTPTQSDSRAVGVVR